MCALSFGKYLKPAEVNKQNRLERDIIDPQPFAVNISLVCNYAFQSSKLTVKCQLKYGNFNNHLKRVKTIKNESWNVLMSHVQICAIYWDLNRPQTTYHQYQLKKLQFKSNQTIIIGTHQLININIYLYLYRKSIHKSIEYQYR